MIRVPEFLIVEHAKAAMVGQDSGFRADKSAIALWDMRLRQGLTRIVGVSTFHTKYPKEQL
jgi:hypothetical protein